VKRNLDHKLKPSNDKYRRGAYIKLVGREAAVARVAGNEVQELDGELVRLTHRHLSFHVIPGGMAM